MQMLDRLAPLNPWWLVNFLGNPTDSKKSWYGTLSPGSAGPPLGATGPVYGGHMRWHRSRGGRRPCGPGYLLPAAWAGLAWLGLAGLAWV